MKSAWVIATVIITVLVVPSCTGAAGLTAPDIVFSAPGQELASNLTLDQAQDSISGYDITITLKPAGIAQITRVEYPVWAVITQTSDLPGETVRMRAANIQESAIPSSGSVRLARIYAVSSASGTVTEEIVNAEVDNYAGSVVVSITPTGTIPTATVTEGDLGSISYTAPEVTGGTTISTTATPITTSTSTTSQTPLVTSIATTAPFTAEQTTGNVIEATPSTPTTLPTTIPGPGPVAIVLAGVFAAILATGWIKRD